MTAAWLWARSRVRRRWRTLLVIAVVTGLGAGVALTAANGSRRAATGLGRFRAATLAPDLLFSPPDPDPALLQRVARMSGVAALGAFTYTPVAPKGATPGGDAGAFVALDPGFTTSVYRPRILEGRRPDPRRADEVTINRALADLAHIRAGDRVALRAGFPPGPFKDLGAATVTGIHVGQFDVGANGAAPSMLLGDTFRRAHERELTLGGQPAVVVRLTAGERGVADFQRRVRSIYHAGVVVVTAKQDAAATIDAVNVQKVGLLLLALAAALATLVAAVQAVGRAFGAERADIGVLRSLGMRRRQLAAAGAGIGALIGAVAAVIGVVTASLASTLVPTGLAGRLEPMGLRVEPAVLGAGAVLLLALLALAGGAVALRVASPLRAAGRAQPAPGVGPFSVRLGVHWTFSRSNPGAATGSARAALVAVIVGVAGIAAVVTFAASLRHLVETTRLYGWDFDAVVATEQFDRPGLIEASKGLADDRRVEALAWGSVVDVPVGPGAVELFALDQARGFLHPSLIEGRAPVGSDEISLGTETLSSIGAHVGSRVTLGPDEGPHVSFRVVGRAVYPEIGNNSDLASAGSITIGGLARLPVEPLSSFALIRVRPGADVDAVLQAHVGKDMEGVKPGAPARVRNIKAVGALPWLMAGFLAALALVAVGHALALSVRARRHDLAVLRAIGAVRSQVAAAVWSQATLTVVIGSVVGLPIGIAVGRQAWALIANGLGVVDEPVVAWGLLGALLGAVLVVSNLMATGPAIVAARLRPAAALRSE
ncbi:MAG: putative transport system permease protein [Actinomycetota bacterium]|jgi:hypothetical protein